MRGIYWLAEELAAFQEALCLMELDLRRRMSGKVGNFIEISLSGIDEDLSVAGYDFV